MQRFRKTRSGNRSASRCCFQVLIMIKLTLSHFTRFVLLLLLSGCMTVPISSIPKLMRLDFLTTNFEHVRVGLQLPAYLSLGSGDAVMIIRSATDGVKGETVDTFALIEDADTVARAQFHAEKRAGTATSVWRMKPEEVSRLTTLQEKVRRSRIEGPRIRGSTEIEILRACVAGVLPTGPIYFSTYIKPAENEDYIPMTMDADLVRVFGAGEVAARIRQCES
ncbi:MULTISPECIES: hypothetical protein [Rhizobium/Agrobacterium group]|uniref:hypothetical protein n=1 Tax=Rhizobium/Agrobacterium group TaxID=227290 RepID=UPI001F3BB437|nr:MULTISPECIES: hypothetical protein [Rhizobium/Agrobacterium group]